VMTSPDGVTWTSRKEAEDNLWLAVSWSPGLHLFAAVAISENGNPYTGNHVMTSPDGITWTIQTSADANQDGWSAIAWSPSLGIFAAVADSRIDHGNKGSRVMISGSAPSNTAPAFSGGSPLSLAVCQDSGPNPINSLLQINDTDTAQTETWTVLSGPAHGALGGFPDAGTSTGGTVAPAGLTYTPAT